jgi:hypothetical protein
MGCSSRPGARDPPATHWGVGDWRPRLAVTGVVPIGGKSEFKAKITGGVGDQTSSAPQGDAGSTLADQPRCIHLLSFDDTNVLRQPRRARSPALPGATGSLAFPSTVLVFVQTDSRLGRGRCSLPLRPVRRCSRPGVQPARTSASVHQSGPVTHALSEAPGRRPSSRPVLRGSEASRFRAMRPARRRRARAQ